MKKLLCTVLSMLLAAGLLASCAQNAQNGAAQSSSAGESASEAAPSAPAAEAATEPASETAPEAAAPGEKWHEKYAEPVTVSIGRRGGAELNWPEGEDFSNNAYMNWLRDTFNIDARLAFLITDEADYRQKVTLAIASSDLPDVLEIHDQLQFNEIASAGLASDLTGMFDEYASPLLKDMAESFGGLESAMATTFSGGRQFGMSELNPGAQDWLFWIREDWRLALDLPEPKTLDDFVALAQAFVDADMAGGGQTIGLELGKAETSVLGGGYNSLATFEPFFFDKGAYHGHWIDDGAGNYIYGTTAPAMKDALALARDMYQSGIIAKDFSTSDSIANISSGFPGVLSGPWWIIGWPLNYTIANNPDALWKSYSWVGGDGKFKTIVQPYNGHWSVVRAGYPNPEALIKLLNVSAEYQVEDDGEIFAPEERAGYGFIIPDEVLGKYLSIELGWNAWPTSIALRYNDSIVRQAKRLREQVDDVRSGGGGYNDRVMDLVGNILKYENGDKSFDPLDKYMRYRSMMLELEVYDTMDVEKVAYPATTPTMETRGANLKDLEIKALLDIVMGNKPLEYFDTFVQEWHSQGGEQITKEVNEQMKK